MTQISDILLSALRDSAAQMTTDLRKSAISSGWPAAAVSRLGIEFDGTEMQLQTDDPSIEDLEYGGLNSQPNPAIRKWLTSDSTIKVFSTSIEKRLKEGIK